MKEISYLGISLLEWIGYLASVLVLVSLSLSSLKKLRLFNLAGAAVFAFYGFAIGSLPVGIMNSIICVFNIYYLQKMFLHTERFDIIEETANSEYIRKFIEYYKKDIAVFFPQFKIESIKTANIFVIIRDANIAGIFICSEVNDQSSNIILDYVTPVYRDYKTGSFFYSQLPSWFKTLGISQLYCDASHPKYIKFLKRMGFNYISGKQVYSLKF